VRYQLKTSSKFNKVKKRLPSDLRRAVDREVKRISEEPSLGELKTGPLSGVRVHKFGCLGQLYLLAYEVCPDENTIYVYAIGGHENFYRDLDRYLKS